MNHLRGGGACAENALNWGPFQSKLRGEDV